MPEPTSPPPSTPPPPRPWWVRIAVLGHPSKTAVRLAVWFFLLGAFGFFAYGLAQGQLIRSSIGFLICLLGALWHDRALAWIDRNGGWKT